MTPMPALDWTYAVRWQHVKNMQCVTRDNFTAILPCWLGHLGHQIYASIQLSSETLISQIYLSSKKPSVVAKDKRIYWIAKYCQPILELDWTAFFTIAPESERVDNSRECSFPTCIELVGYRTGYLSSSLRRSSYRLLQTEVSHLQTVASYSLALQHRKMSDTPHPKPDNAQLVIKRKSLRMACCQES